MRVAKWAGENPSFFSTWGVEGKILVGEGVPGFFHIISAYGLLLLNLSLSSLKREKKPPLPLSAPERQPVLPCRKSCIIFKLRKS
jgi:hypothetical protein